MRRRFAGCSCTWILAMALLFFIGSDLAPERAAEAAVAGKIRVGVIYSLTGTGAPTGKTQLDGALLAIKEVNKQGGLVVGGKRVQVEAVVRDDETKADVGIRRYRELLADGINVIVSGTFADISTALNQQAKAGDSFVMVTNGIEEKVFRKDEKAPYFLSSLGAVDAIGRICADYVAKTYKPKRVILCLPDYAYGHGAFTGAMQVFGSRYPDIKVSVVWTPVGTPDFTPYIIKIMEAKPDVVMMGQWGTDAIEIVKQAYELGLAKHTRVFFNSLNASLTLGMPPEALDGVTIGVWLYHDLSAFKDKDPATVKAVEELNAAWRAEYGAAPDVMAVYAYIGMKETLRAISLAGSTDPAKMYKALMDNPQFMSVKGPAYWRVDGRPFYTYAKFIATGKGAAERDDKWDWCHVFDAYKGEELALPLKDMGY
ncbi:MAG TPA: ABC transporter substrate-binding protein [Firmicutes bacterium]|nr:ABC transporter substrate-binding protein [Bacillota bacterium]